eukprot:4632254-Pleurochrysis_carterae.AAC.1
MSSQLPLLEWLAIFARSAVVQPTRSSRRACFRLLGSKLAADATRAEPSRSLKSWRGLRTVSSAAGVLLRSGYAPRPRWKCWCRSSSSVPCVSDWATSVGEVGSPALVKLGGATSGR